MPSPTSAIGTSRAVLVGVERIGHDRVGRQMQRDVRRLRLGDDRLRGRQVGIAQRSCRRRRPARPGTCWPCRRRCTNASTRASRFVNTPTLSATFAPPIAHTYGWAGSCSNPSSARSSASIKNPAQPGDRRATPVGRGVRAVRGAERVVDVEFGVGREVACECGSFASSPGWKRTFSSSSTSPSCSAQARFADRLADAVVDERRR